MLITVITTMFLTLLDILNQYHDLIIAVSVIFGGGWWWLNLINKLITKKISGENSSLFLHLDENKKHILTQIEALSSYTKNKDELLMVKIENLSSQLTSELKNVNARIDTLEENYNLLLSKFLDKTNK